MKIEELGFDVLLLVPEIHNRYEKPTKVKEQLPKSAARRVNSVVKKFSLIPLEKYQSNCFLRVLY